MLDSFLFGEFLLHVPNWIYFSVRSFSYRSHPSFFSPPPPPLLFLIWGVFLTLLMLASFLFEEFLFNIRCWLHFYMGSFSYTSHCSFCFLCGEFLLHIPCYFHFYAGSFSDTSRASFFYYLGSFSYTFRDGCFFGFFFFFFFFYRGSFSYTSRAGFIFI